MGHTELPKWKLIDVSAKQSATHIDTHHVIFNRSITTQTVKLTENFGMIFAKYGTYGVA
jgi:hypothetical protein